jgi:fermentation-respiration switch protein FrsA (DUF1100 family)
MSRKLLLLSLALLASGAVAFFGASWLLGGRLAAPSPGAAGPIPADLPREAIAFPSASGSTIQGWFAPGRPGAGGVVLMHGVRANRASLLPRARLFHQAGYSVLLFDFQAHGESPGKHITFGYLESRDVRAAVAYARKRLPGERLGGLGMSLGGAATLLGPQPAGFDAVVLESVYPTLEEAVRDRIHIRLGALATPLTPLLLLQIRPRLGFSPRDLRPIDGIGRLGAPVLVLAGDADRHTPLAETRRLYDAARAPKDLWIVPGAAHVDLYTYAGPEYARRVLAFFAAHLR